MPSVSSVKESWIIDRSASSSIVYTRYIGASGATSRTSARTSGAMTSARGGLDHVAGGREAQEVGVGPTSG